LLIEDTCDQLRTPALKSTIENRKLIIDNTAAESQSMSIVYRGRVFSVEVLEKRLPNGHDHQFEIVRHPPSIVLVPFEADGRLVLVRQYRAPVDRELWECPAGTVNPNEPADAAARRECEEEIGLIPGSLRRLGGWYPSPGYCDEEMIFFRAWDLAQPPPGSRRPPDEDEFIHAERFTVDEARAMLARGDIVDLKSAFALSLV
jgi:ADP-ribose pyrophosphatase